MSRSWQPISLRPLTRGAHGDVTLLQVGFILAHRPAPDENVTLQAFHGAAYGPHHRVDLHGDLTCRSQDKNLRGRKSYKKNYKQMLDKTRAYTNGGK